MSMVEAMARKLAIHACGGRDDWNKWAEFDRQPYRDQAIAALKALRDPTPEMVEAGQAVDCTITAEPVWQAMIDAALDGEG
ncbi:hypothetical protein [Sphingobium chungbukense]|uniref:Uncharacterized protein n=1 Tax=Sphingobium chungbukense TaxID=56193 RepID=A0A0M3AVN2_9SPHN|nr:hypothetical protein [Sphingobium chungbukense]KKW92634.1 hypothetical protein YP76_06775 [Sphingobium chungbukense]